MNENRVHQIFQFSVIAKGLHALIECAGGLLFYFLSTDAILRLVNWLTREELLEDPRDLVATRLLDAAQHLTGATESFYAIYLLSHGVIKILLVYGLLRGKLLAYPLSLFTLAMFIVYQLYRYSYTQSAGLLVLTVFDLAVIVLVWHEWRILRHHVARR